MTRVTHLLAGFRQVKLDHQEGSIADRETRYFDENPVARGAFDENDVDYILSHFYR